VARIDPLPGFLCVERPEGVLMVREAYRARLESLGLLEPGGVRPPGNGRMMAAGRGRLLVLPLDPQGRESALLRTYTHGGALRWLFRSWFTDRQRPFRELALMEQLAAWGVPTLRGLAAAARRVFPGVYRPVLVTLFEQGATDLLAFLLQEPSPARRRRVLEEAGRVVRLLHAREVAHADLHPRNILVTQGELPRVLIIDLDQSRVRPGLDETARVRVLARLERFLRKYREREGLVLGRMERMRFLKGYYGRLGDRGRRELARVERRLARNLPWHRGVWALESLLTGRFAILRRHLDAAR